MLNQLVNKKNILNFLMHKIVFLSFLIFFYSTVMADSEPQSCDNNCSGHGTCNIYSGVCDCDLNYDSSTGCSTCISNISFADGCSVCSGENMIQPDCVACRGNWGPDSDCSTCIGNYDSAQDCKVCLPNYDIHNECKSCIGWFDINSGCTNCISDGKFELGSNCNECRNNYDINTGCTQCTARYSTDNDCIGGDVCEFPYYSGFGDSSCNLIYCRKGSDLSTIDTSCGDAGFCDNHYGMCVCTGSTLYPENYTIDCECMPGLKNDDNNHCSLCSEDKRDPSTQCKTCNDYDKLPTYPGSDDDCEFCIKGARYDTANCEQCGSDYTAYDPNFGCLICTEPFADPNVNCTECLNDRFAFPACGSDASCISPAYDPWDGNCTLCDNDKFYPGIGSDLENQELCWFCNKDSDWYESTPADSDFVPRWGTDGACDSCFNVNRNPDSDCLKCKLMQNWGEYQDSEIQGYTNDYCTECISPDYQNLDNYCSCINEYQVPSTEENDPSRCTTCIPERKNYDPAPQSFCEDCRNAPYQNIESDCNCRNEHQEPAEPSLCAVCKTEYQYFDPRSTSYCMNCYRSWLNTDNKCACPDYMNTDAPVGSAGWCMECIGKNRNVDSDCACDDGAIDSEGQGSPRAGKEISCCYKTDEVTAELNIYWQALFACKSNRRKCDSIAWTRERSDGVGGREVPPIKTNITLKLRRNHAGCDAWFKSEVVISGPLDAWKADKNFKENVWGNAEALKSEDVFKGDTYKPLELGNELCLDMITAADDGRVNFWEKFVESHETVKGLLIAVMPNSATGINKAWVEESAGICDDKHWKEETVCLYGWKERATSKVQRGYDWSTNCRPTSWPSSTIRLFNYAGVVSTKCKEIFAHANGTNIAAEKAVFGFGTFEQAKTPTGIFNEYGAVMATMGTSFAYTDTCLVDSDPE